MVRKQFAAICMIFVMVVGLCPDGASQARGGENVRLSGHFGALWGDGREGDSPANETHYILATAEGDYVQLVLDEAVLMQAGGITALNRQPVRVAGTWIEAPQAGNRTPILQVQAIELDVEAGGHPVPDDIIGPQPWVSILCKFSDIPNEPNNLTYFQGMYSSAYPGLDHYWRQQSYDLANLQGSGAFGWYTLPYTRGHYVPPVGYMDWGAAAADCTGAADPFVEFTDYVGINLMFNADLDCCAWGGGWYLCLDGLCQTWRMTWEPPWGYQNIGVIAHETGHGFGLPHSSGDYGQTYDNAWDVMSDVWGNGNRGGIHPVYGTMGQHTISYHKDMLGWITDEHIFIAPAGTLRTLTLERLALPQTENYLGAQVLVDSSPDHFFTVEARQLAGYDSWLPRLPGWNQAVIIHEVVMGRENPAHVVDIDGNGYTDDDGAIFLPGETFSSPSDAIEISVLSATATGFVISIRNQYTDLEGVSLSGATQGYLGQEYTFSAAAEPPETTIPITYVWEASGQLPITNTSGSMDAAVFAWDEPGTKTITVTASNLGGSGENHLSIEILPMGVLMNGATQGSVEASYVFTGTVLPDGLPLPITYTWQASEQIPVTHTSGLSDTISYLWDLPGNKAITLTAETAQGTFQTVHRLTLFIPPESVQIEGPVVGYMDQPDSFSATLSPETAGLPVTYVWAVNGQEPITHTSGLTDTVLISWDAPGNYTITLTASNPGGAVMQTWNIVITQRAFLPVLRK